MCKKENNVDVWECINVSNRPLNVQLVVVIEYFWMWFFFPLPNILYDARILVSDVCARVITMVYMY